MGLFKNYLFDIYEDLEQAIKFYIKDKFNRELTEEERENLISNLDYELFEDLEGSAVNLYIQRDLLKKYGFEKSYKNLGLLLNDYLYLEREEF